MIRKFLIPFVLMGIVFGFSWGLLSTFSTSGAQGWYSQKLYWLILTEGVSRINQSTAIGFALSFFLSFVLFILVLLWKKYLSQFIEVHVTHKLNFQSWVRGFWTFSLIAFSILLFIKHASHKIPMIPLALSQMIILSILCFFLFSRKKTAQSKTQTQQLPPLPGFNTLKKVTVICAALMIVANLVHTTRKQFFRPKGPNILVVVADALRADHLGCYGYTGSISPYIDRFAKSSILFEKHFSNAPWTKPSMGTFFTSLSPSQHGAYYWTDNLKNANLSMAEVFRNKNYRTMAIQTNPSITAQHDFSQGFQDFIELPMENGTAVIKEFDVWLKKKHKNPFFAYVHLMDTHMPYNASEEILQLFHLDNDNSSESIDFNTMDIRILSELGLNPDEKTSLLELYERAVRDIDSHFERLIESLSANNVLENTFIIFTSDHGEEFWNHEGFAHGHSLYNELMHVPLLLHFPKLHSPGRITSYTQHLDVFPTLLSLFNIQIPNTLNGEDLTPLLSSPTTGKNFVFYLEGILYGADKKGVIRNGWKLIENTTSRHDGTLAPLGDLENHRKKKPWVGYELYDISQDFSEQTNLADQYPEITRELKKLLLENKSVPIPPLYQKKSDLEKKIDDLKSLGYIK